MTAFHQPRCSGLRYTYVTRNSLQVIKTCNGCQDCSSARLQAAATSKVGDTAQDSHVRLLERRCERLEVTLREALVYVDPGSTDGADLRERIGKLVPRGRT